jgi:signal transduction histidine kinase
VGAPATDWNHLSARVATFFLLGGSLGYLSQRERQARAEAERLNAELRENQARLVQSERLAAIGQMSAKVSHEVRNPLSSISLNAELLEDELRSLSGERRAEAANLVAAIRSQVDVLSAVTEEYLRFARLPKPKLEVATVTPVIEDLADFVREELRARKVELVVNVPAGQPRLRLDPGQIRQALLNLIRNAVEAMPEGGTVSVAARRVKLSNGQLVDTSRPIDDLTTRPIDKGDFIEIEVRDTGTGIPPENLDRIFEPFFTNKEGGTGLGLAIARQIAVDHGGNLACESTRGVGTTFRLTLPIPDGGRVP